MITIPTVSQLYTAILSDLETEYSASIPTFGKNFLRAVAAVQAAKLKIYYLAIAKLQKNIFVDTAEPEASGGTLERFGRIKLGRNPFAATAGQYVVEVTGTIGATIPAGSTFKSDDDSDNPGALFVLDSSYTLVSATDSITVRALEAGTDSKLSVGDTMTATAPIANVDGSVEVLSESVEPQAAEEIEDYRDKALASYQLEPQGGAATDYRLWSQDAQGVEETYPYARSGDANEINLYVEATIADSIDGKGTPSAALLSDVESVVEFDPDTTKPLNERGRRPLGVFEVHYLPIVPKDIDIEIPNFVDLTAAKQTAIENALTEAINQIRPFNSAADILENKNDILDVNKIVSVTLLAVPGSTFDTPVLKVDTVSMSTYTFLNGFIPYVNSITFT